MESTETDRTALISDIEADAQVEAGQILKEAENQAAEKREYAEKQVASLLDDARKKAQDQAEAIAKRALSAADLEIKRRSMGARDAVMRDIMDRVEKELEAMIDDAQRYRPVLADWIAEAALGLGAASAEVNASGKERTLIDDQLLAEAGGKVHAQTNRHVKLTLSAAPPLKSQGVVLTALDGRTAFNNQVKTRLQRSQRQIRTLIYDALFTDNRKE
jgi:vacuolar-type H+-ATPase subunit E/Vma4